MALDRLLSGAYRERRHQSALQRQDAPLGDHRPCDLERASRGSLADGLLERDRAQLARLERRGALGQALLDAILEGTLDAGAVGMPRSAARLVGRSRSARRSRSRPVGGRARVTSSLALRFSSFRLAQLAALGRAPALRAEALGGSGDLAAARGERVEQTARHPGDLEVAAMFAGASLDRITPLLRARARAPSGSTHRPPVRSGRSAGKRPRRSARPRGSRRDDDVAVQLRVGRLRTDDPAAVVCRYSAAISSRACSSTYLAAVAAAHDRHRLGEVSRSLRSTARGVRRLDLATLVRVPERPHGRHRLRGAERHVDPAATAAGGARPAQERHRFEGGDLPSAR